MSARHRAILFKTLLMSIQLEGGQLGFTKVPNKFIWTPDLSGNTKAVGMVILSYHPSRPSYSHLELITGLSRATIAAAIDDLVKTQIISYKKGSNRTHECNNYHIRPEPEWLITRPASLNSKLDLVQNLNQASLNSKLPLVQNLNSNKTNPNKTKLIRREFNYNDRKDEEDPRTKQGAQLLRELLIKSGLKTL
jgi:hypothetical protein